MTNPNIDISKSMIAAGRAVCQQCANMSVVSEMTGVYMPLNVCQLRSSLSIPDRLCERLNPESKCKNFRLKDTTPK